MTRSMGACVAQAAALEQLDSAVVAWIAGNDIALLSAELRANPTALRLSTPNLVEFAANQQNYEAVTILMSFVDDTTPFRRSACLERLYNVAVKNDDTLILREYPLDEIPEENFNNTMNGLYELACAHGSFKALQVIHPLHPPDEKTWSKALLGCLTGAHSTILSFLMTSPTQSLSEGSSSWEMARAPMLLKHMSELYIHLSLNNPSFFCAVFDYATCEQVCAHIPLSHHDRVKSMHQHYVTQQALRQRTKLDGALENSFAPPRGRKL